MATSNSIPKSYLLEKLTSSNYNIWSVKMELLLTLNDLFSIVNGKEPNPGSADVALQQVWQSKDAKARATIILHCGDKQIGLVKSLQTSTEVWDKLESTYKQTDLASQVTAQKKLTQLVMNEDTPIIAFIEEFQGVLEEVSNSGLIIPDDQQYVQLLGALAPSWRTFVTAQGSNTNKTLSNLISRILEEAAMRQYGDSKQSPIITSKSGAFLARNQYTNNNWKQKSLGNNSKFKSNTPMRKFGVPQSGNSFPPKTIVCHHCGKLGHKRPDCRILAREKAQGAYKYQANITSNNNSNIPSSKPESLHLFIVTEETNSNNSLTWYLDTGATCHMTPIKTWFISYKYLNPPLIIYTGDDAQHEAIGRGTVQIKLKNGDITNIQDVLHVPTLAKNLLSVCLATTQCKSIEFFHNYCTIKTTSKDGKEITLQFNQIGNLYPLEVENIEKKSTSLVISKTPQGETILWHHRLGHVNPNTLKEVSKIEKNISINLSHLSLCESCLAGKQHKISFPKGISVRASKPLESIHSDVCGPMQTTSIKGFRYFVTYIDDYSRFTAIYFFKE